MTDRPGTALVNQFIEKAKAISAEVELCPTGEDAARRLRELLQQSGAGKALISAALQGKVPYRTELAGFTVLFPEGTLWFGAGVVEADYGVAETGTLVCFDRSDEEKAAWTLPDVCYCLLDCRRIVPAMTHLAQEITRHLARTDLPSPQVSLVTGPSRTADIECELTIGVHGPARLVILLIGIAAPDATG